MNTENLAPQENTETVPSPVTVPTQIAEDGSSIELGYTEADPNGPPAKDESLLAGKFKSAEELEKAYRELESKLGKPEDAPKENAQEDDADAPKLAGLETTDEAAAMLKERGLDIATFTKEYERSGQLSPESYAALEAKGITRGMVNDYINGQQVLVESQVAQVKNSVGGAEEYTKLTQWAAVNLDATQQRAYQTALDTNDLSLIMLAASGLKAQYDKAMGSDPRVVVGGSAPRGNDGLERFGSWEQVMAAMGDPRYSEDPAYRAQVEKKLNNSNFN